MQQQTNSNSKTFILLGILLVLGGVYYLYTSGNKTVSDAGLAPGSDTGSIDTSFATADVSDGSDLVTPDVLSILNKIRELRIDPAIFQDASYQSLVDFSIAIPPENVGRPNPFAPISGSVVSSPAGAAASRSLRTGR
ncbi:MAG: hypothetical protein RIT04_660 [Candidatus Parcubacteria bacterium]|jgi:hypothetical protein